MQRKKTGLLILSVVLSAIMIPVLSSFTTTQNLNKISCEFRAVSGDLAGAEADNCNNDNSANNVAAGTGWATTLMPVNCDYVNLTTTLPDIHPAGTIRIYRNGVLYALHPVAQNQQTIFSYNLPAARSDQFLVTW
jgi:hypothetical protein